MTKESQDLDSDPRRITALALNGFAEEQRESSARRTNAGSAALSVSSSPNDNDIMVLQTAASIENLAVSVYTTAAGLPFIKSGNATVAAFIAKTTAQHTAHAEAFNAALTRAGAKTQTGPDPKYAAVVKSALPGIKTPGDVVSLAITLEDVAAQTYAKYVALASNASMRTLFGSIAPVEAMHAAVLQFVLGRYPGPDAFLGTGKAASPALLTV